MRFAKYLKQTRSTILELAKGKGIHDIIVSVCSLWFACGSNDIKY